MKELPRIRDLVAAVMALGALGVVAYLAIVDRSAEATGVLVAILIAAVVHYLHDWAPGRGSDKRTAR